MPLYNFTLTLSGVTSETDRLEDILFLGGCDDALICCYGKSVYLEFDREADSLDDAISTAITDVESVEVGIRVTSVDSALVGLSDIAELTGLTRQAIALLKDGLRGNGNFPSPIQRIKGQSPLWDWADVADWLEKNNRLHKYPELSHQAKILCKWNLALRVCNNENYVELQRAIENIWSLRCKKPNKKHPTVMN